MVYTVKCDECGKVAEFGREREYRENKVERLDDYIKFDDRTLCKECVEDLVRFGIGDIQNKLDNIEKVIDELGREAGVDVEDIKQAYLEDE